MLALKLSAFLLCFSVAKGKLNFGFLKESQTEPMDSLPGEGPTLAPPTEETSLTTLTSLTEEATVAPGQQPARLTGVQIIQQPPHLSTTTESAFIIIQALTTISPQTSQSVQPELEMSGECWL